jgi:FkbM family methyltransferase
MKIAYDVGMNNGDDTHYFLSKGFKVIAIEANPDLCEIARRRFSDVISNGRCVILNCGISDEDGFLDFYIDKHSHTTSTFVPQPNNDGRYVVRQIPIRQGKSIVHEFGEPYLFKIDIEGLDFLVLRNVFNHGIFPPYLSAEAHSLRVLCLIISMGYDQFKLSEGSRIGTSITKCDISSLDGDRFPFCFNLNSSGPFGDDLDTPWVDSETIVSNYLKKDSSWCDIHARSSKRLHEIAATADAQASPLQFVNKSHGYWDRYRDVDTDSRYGRYGSIGYLGAFSHYIDFGKSEGRFF